MRKQIRHVAQRLRKQANKRLRRVQKWAAINGPALSSLWLRYEDEARACPACGSPELTVMDVLRVRADMTGRRLAFLTGCETCGLLFTNPIPPPEEAARFYAEDGRWGEAHAERAAHLAAAHERRVALNKPPKPYKRQKRTLLLDAMQPWVPIDAPPPGAKAIDFGCGEGKLLNSLQDAGWETYGIEPSSGVAFLRHRRLEEPPQDRSFDFVFLHHVLEHVRNPLQVLQQLAGALREGGVLFVSVPRLDTLPVHRDLKYCIDGHKHLMCFSQASLTWLLGRAGFSVAGDLHRRELDEALTEGRPLRLRLVATRVAVPPPVPATPLQAGLEALRRYAGAERGFTGRMRHWRPVRFRAALMDRSREKSKGRRPRRAA